MRVLLTLNHDDEVTKFSDEKHQIYGIKTYTPGIWDELSKVRWRVDEKNLLKI